MKENYTEINSRVIDNWVDQGWEWSKPISHQAFLQAKQGKWQMLLTPSKPVPHEWFCPLAGAKVLGLACGGAQQMPVFAALGAEATVLDYSRKQLASEEEVARREGYEIRIIHADMTKPLPFADGEFDLIFHPVSNCYIEDVYSVWHECYRVLKKGGSLLAGLDNGIGFMFNDDETELVRKLPFNPLKDPQQYQECLDNDWGIQFSHKIEEQVGGQLQAGFRLTDIFEDTDNSGKLAEYNLPLFFATRAVKE